VVPLAATATRAATPAVTSAPATEPATLAANPNGGPDDSWTVTRLRAEARARGVSGYSRKTKVQLLDDLRGPAD
jgi:hypothetical protein